MCHTESSFRFAPAVLLVFAVSLPAMSLSGASEELEIVYLANEGFLLRSGETAILIDALFGTGIRGYPVVPESERAFLEAGSPPYDGVDLVLASHSHRDHFDAGAVARFLDANPETHFLSTEHAVREVLEVADVGARSRGVYPAEGDVVAGKINGISVTVFNLHHGRGRQQIQNLGLLIEICGTTVLHIGDTEASASDMRAAGLENIEPDVALLPSWHLRTDGLIEGTREVVRPARVVAMHLPTREAPENYFWGELTSQKLLVEAIRQQFPGAFVPLETGQRISVPCGQP